MARDVNNQVWLTSALTEEDVKGALTLCSSLRRTLTSRKVGVIVSRKLGFSLREALRQAFDYFFDLDEDRNLVGLKDDEFVKIYALTLKPLGKCVYLCPTMLVLKNCDEIFDNYNAPHHAFQWTKDEGLSVFLVNPSLEAFNVVMNLLRTKNGTGFEKFLRNWMGKDKNGNNFLDDKYNLTISTQTGQLGFEDNTNLGLNLMENGISIVNLKNVEFDSEINPFGFLAEIVLKYRKLIYTEAVLPFLHSLENLGRLETIPEFSSGKIYQQAGNGREPIAIVGMSCRYPNSNNLEEFWNLLINGMDGTSIPPEFRWTPKLSIRNPAPYRQTNAGFLKTPVEEFDAKFFGISPLEMEYLDPQHRLLHEVIWEGLEDAAVNPQKLRGTNGGVFMGSWTNDYKEILEKGGNKEFYRKYMGNSIGAAAARISFLLGITGPSIATESGCSSAMVAVHLACRSLQLRETNFALACGVNLLLHPFDKNEMPMVLSSDGCCKTFDEKADGFARAEGCGVLVLKRLSDAVKDGDNIWAMIRGSGMTQEGVSKSMGTPTVQCESLAMKHALEDAGVEPEQVSYVEAHGTGTVVGDPMEIAAIAKAYHSKERKEPLLIGSVKTNVGHTESCSGITGIMKAVLAMQNEIIPAHRNFETLNPAINLEAVPAKIPLKPVNWRKTEGKSRFAGVSSFGMTGTDAHVILEESPKIPKSPMKISKNFERPLSIMKISAKTEEALNILLERYKNYLNSTQNLDFKDITYTANIGRADFSHRAILMASSTQDAVKNIETNKITRGNESVDKKKVCFLFTGQGSQYPGMGKQLYETSPVFRMHFEYCSKILKNTYNIDITQVLWSEAKSVEVSRTIYSQTSIFCVEYALLKLWESWGVKADYALGHSLGEFAAAICAGILSVEDAIKLVAERSRLIDELPPGKMLVIKGDKQRVKDFMTKFAQNDQTKIPDFAAINSPEQTVVAGDSELILQFSEFCNKSKLKCIVLGSTHAFHSKQMDPMLDDYRKVAETIKRRNGNDCKFLSGMRGSIFEASQIDAEYWVQHTRKKVLFLEASKKAVELGCEVFIEIGPQPVLSALTMMNTNQTITCLPSLKRNWDEWETLLNSLAKLYVNGTQIDWEGFDQFFNRKKVPLPHYPFIGKKYWPELACGSNSTIHPLLGSLIPNATSTKLFQSQLSLKNPSLEYLSGHAIGEKVIFPGAGYLEMSLAAGLASIDGNNLSKIPNRPIKVENLFFQAPLPLDNSSTCELQSVVEGDWNEMEIKIYRKMEETETSNKWLCHSKATFSPVPSAEEKAVQFLSADVFNQILAKPPSYEWIETLYEKLNSSGLKFGSTFRRLEKVWVDDKVENFLAQVLSPNWDNSMGQSENQYIIHPVILDAMIQAGMMLRIAPTMKKKMYVPVKIGKFLLFSAVSTSSQLYIYAFYEEKDSPFGSALLLDEEGKALALMSSVEYTATTVKAIDSILEQQTSTMPGLWEEVWRSKAGCLGPAEDRVDLEKTSITSEALQIIPDDYNFPPTHLAELFTQVEKLVYLNMLRSLLELGWKPELGESFEDKALLNQLGIQNQSRQYFGFILGVLENEGILERNSANFESWTVKKMPPSLEEIMLILNSTEFSTELEKEYSTTPLFSKVGENLSKILQGRQPALNILFPEENQGYPSVAEFYTTYEQKFQLRNSAVPKCVKRFKHMREQMGEQKFVIRILEIGAGTGSFSENLLRMLDQSELEFEYTYTDISAAFFTAAQKRFGEHLKSFKFKKLNIEQDPIEQGFIPEYYDLICASDVIHATRDIRESLQNMRMLLKPSGLLDIQEMSGVHRFVTYLFGLLDGFWRFEDKELRPRHCTLSGEQWKNVLKTSGFEVDGLFPTMNSYHSYIWARKTGVEILPKTSTSKTWVIFHQRESQVSGFLKEKIEEKTTRKIITVVEGQKWIQGEAKYEIRRDNEDDFIALFNSLKASKTEIEGIVYCWALGKRNDASQEETLQPYFYLTKSLLNSRFSTLPKIISVTSGVIPIKEQSSSSFPLSTLVGFTKSLKNENFELNVKYVDIDEECRGLQEIFTEMWNCDEEEFLIAFRNGTKYVPKLEVHKPIANPLSLPPGTDRFQLILPESRSITDLQFGPLEPKILGEDEVEVEIKASALNFRDVLSIIKPSEEFRDINTVGFDFAGLISKTGKKVTGWKVGDQVCGCNIHFTALPSHVVLNEKLVLRVPHNLPLWEAATMPAVYMTSLQCLKEVAKIKKEDVVLIHTASGGVGLSVIEICKSVGCKIIATAGSKRKQNYLRSLGIEHIFHSRNTNFGDEILELTNGRGVDVVLNSLTSEGFKEATLKACTKGARFVEMSKLNIWSEEEVKKMRPDVEYTTIDLSLSDKEEWIRLMNKLKGLLNEGIVKPIPYLRFDALNVREALQYMQKTKHIGKIVCVMPELRNETGGIKLYTPMFNENSTYLITGGLGGIGFVVCEWMVEKGAKNIILAGRNLPSSSIQKRISKLNERKANIIPVQLDVGNMEQCRELLNSKIAALGLPPLKGIMHAAGTLADSLVINQDWGNLSSTFPPKIQGTLNLHELTKKLKLEHFVLFSSIAALFGNPGQCNHAAGNSFEDAFAHYRNSLGLPATTINWGQWGEVGIATEVDLPGIKAISNLQGITGLEYALKKHRTQTAIFNITTFAMLSKLFPHLSLYLDEGVWKKTEGELKGSDSTSWKIRSEEFWKNYSSFSSNEEKIELLNSQIKSILQNTLKLDENEVIGDNADMQEMGVDSLMFVEIKNGIQTLLGDKFIISASSLRDCNTVKLLSTTVVRLIEGDAAENCVVSNGKPTMDEVNTLMREDCELPSHIRAKPGQELGKISDVRSVLVTGATGNLGPYILKELTKLPQIQEVYCLMRPHKKGIENKFRIQKILEDLELDKKVDMEKLHFVTGNVAEPHLGMREELWRKLSGELDAIIHCAAGVDHVDLYKKQNTSSKTDSRAVNIGGTKNILEFACEGKLKHVFHASSLVAVLTVDEETGRVSERWPELGEYDNIMKLAYPITKYVSELLLKEAVARGIPCKAFRFPYIGGESGSGRCSLKSNHLMLRFMFIMKSKMVPSTPLLLHFLPVDICAEVSITLFFKEGAKSDVYNIGNGDPVTDQELVRIVAPRFGKEVEIVDYKEFAQCVKKTDGNNALEMFKEFYDEADPILTMYSNAPLLMKWVEEGGLSTDMWWSENVTKLIPDFFQRQKSTAEYVYRDLEFCKNQGWFADFGL